MTNREQAESIAVQSRREIVSCVDLRDMIERALDEADLRCSYKWHKAGYADGQREMRESAAKEVYGDDNAPFYESAGLIRERIRALPIAGEAI